MTDELAENINELYDDKGHIAVMKRCQALRATGCYLEYDGYAVAAKTKCEAFKENLDVIGPRLPAVIERILWNHFFEEDDC